MAQRIFIVEDEPNISRLIAEGLEKWGYEAQVVTAFDQVTTEIAAFEADLVLLDISLPFYNGFHWCQEIRKTSEVPIIFLSSANDKLNIVMAMNLGADDFIGKPFDMQVLVAKIQALLRRSYQFGQTKAYRFGEYELLPQENRVLSATTQVDLTPNESKIMLLLFESKQHVVSREAIMEKLWEGDEFIDSNTLAVNMTRLRKKLDEIGLGSHIQTVKGKGFLLVSPEEDL